MLTYIILGIIQGIFEWIPISSEGVVALASQFLVKGVNAIDLALFLHLGTLGAVLVYFRKDWRKILTFKDLKLLSFIFIATIVSLAIGYPIYKTVKNVALGNFLLVLTGVGLLFTAYFQKKEKKFELDFDKLVVVSGLLQGMAVIPGFSRSGATIFSLSSFSKLSPAEVLKISYMMSAPVVLASSIYLYLNNSFIISDGWSALIFSFLVGFLSLSFLINLSKKIDFFIFALIFALICFLGAGIQYLI